ncbi:sulfur carrier protein ThiS [Cellulophaga lytica]|uniref:Thiamine biosynthesis protein ThiS n=1 Tax=Cellulophaga lytica (strain ATCC 23178 / DSM 7489 / JCM 8516 / NBRC 14961 / NCIMB 1423 / VKM B-1433 / Cy l20) TaxID=867900 RepID=F0RCJ8_CELLC|nr:sulfur carrier protein ThiS [Cellulophaga lytica]ADY29695.1 thiamine biosynthesis protein ThiS [Cellulophaga lytica DSM 7489]AIM60697.1 hypothetical protein IX49_09255 [Cellulophaga lytica]APU10573.1 hypothetical protein A5M85_09850 [Cellulophaga lytica]MDO6852496.1 sulfur carrier protein ThiS [Cellulophaga lytica]WQG76134.1 sulfur carrier protein ThiS [Cellulophaga lytica]
MVPINVNNKEHVVSSDTTIATLIQTLEITIFGVAIAINGNVIPKTDWSTTILQPHDNVLLIRPAQGG